MDSSFNDSSGHDDIQEDYFFKGVRWDQASRVDCIIAYLIDQKFTLTQAKRIAVPQRGTTVQTYEKEWRKYTDWCKQTHRHPIFVSIPDLASFLTHLMDLNRAPRTLLVYMSAISTALELVSERKIGSNKILTNMIKSYSNTYIPKKRAPTWDIVTVLEGLKTVDNVVGKLSHVLYKTTFLLTLAAGARRSEVHGWTFAGLEHDLNWNYVLIKCSKQFIAKNHDRLTQKGKYIPIRINALPHKQDIADPLCPVSALRIYLRRIHRYRGTRTNLLISTQVNKSSDITAPTMSIWIKRGIKLGYRNMTTKLSGRYHAHQVRAYAGSIAVTAGIPLEDVLTAGRWSHQNTFTSCYLIDISNKAQEYFKLHDVATMLHTVGPSTS